MPQGPIDDKPTLVQVTLGIVRPLPEPMLTRSLWLFVAILSQNDLIAKSV